MPADNYKEIGPIEASDGKGCGTFGYEGTYDRALINLKSKAAEQGGDYVKLDILNLPFLVGNCFDNSYTIIGVLFKKVSNTQGE
ncbi:MAG: hypothetical protein HWE27_12140 [Gammaproteobacteria bacterium]|nr:hypothetical protein [Gammaproteobacteria bacterium]